MCLYHILFIHSTFSRYSGCSHLLAITNSAETSIDIHLPFPALFVILLNKYPEMRFQGKSIFNFGGSYTVFHSGCSIVHSTYNTGQGFQFLYSLTLVIFCSFLLTVTILTGEVIFHCGLICISLMISDAEDLFMCLSTICVTLEKCQSRFFVHFKILLSFCCLMVILYMHGILVP